MPTDFNLVSQHGISVYGVSQSDDIIQRKMYDAFSNRRKKPTTTALQKFNSPLQIESGAGICGNSYESGPGLLRINLKDGGCFDRKEILLIVLILLLFLISSFLLFFPRSNFGGCL